MAATGSIDFTAKELMLKGPFIDGTTDYGPVVRLEAYEGTSLIGDYAHSSAIFVWNSTDNKLELDPGETFTIPIPEAATIDKIRLSAVDLNAPGTAYMFFVTIDLGADSVTFQGPGNYTITQLDIDLA